MFNVQLCDFLLIFVLLGFVLSLQFWVLFVRCWRRLFLEWKCYGFTLPTQRHTSLSLEMKCPAWGVPQVIHHPTHSATHHPTLSEAVNRSQSHVSELPPPAGPHAASPSCSIDETVETTTFPVPWVIFTAAELMHYRNKTQTNVMTSYNT